MTNLEYNFFREKISEERKIKAEAFYFSIDAYRCVCAEMLLKYCIGQKYPKTNYKLTYNKYGKPELEGKEFYFNISHSGNWVVLANGKTEVGVDIELIKTGREKTLISVFTEHEKKYIYKVHGLEREKRLTRIWTMKESYLKYIGTGLFTEMKSFTADTNNKGILDENQEIIDDLVVNSCLLEPEYYLSICCADENVEIEFVSLQELMGMF